MITSLQQRLALAVLLGVLLVPVLQANLRGLTHLLTCSDEVVQRFAVADVVDAEPVMTSSTTVLRADLAEAGAPPAADGGTTDAAGGAQLLCGALLVDLSATSVGPGEVEVTVALTNHSTIPWHGSVGLDADGDTVDHESLRAAVGRVAPGAREETVLHVRVPPGQTELGGTLLLGP